jgi:hypothetical protein
MVIMGFRNNHIKRSRRRMTSTYMERRSSSSIRFNRRRKSRRLEMRVAASTVTDSLSSFQASALYRVRTRGMKATIIKVQKIESSNLKL